LIYSFVQVDWGLNTAHCFIRDPNGMIQNLVTPLNWTAGEFEGKRPLCMQAQDKTHEAWTLALQVEKIKPLLC